MKRTLCLLLIITLGVGLFAFGIPAAAEVTAYDLWVADEQITDEHLTVAYGEGTAVYDPAAGTLTLNNADITTGCTIDWLGSGIVSFLDKLTVVVATDSRITETGGEGISTYQLTEDYTAHVPHDLTVTGPGKLTITQSTPSYGYGIYCTGNLVLQGAVLDIEAVATGLWSNLSTTIEDSTVDIHVSTSYSGLVINKGTVYMNSGSVTAVADEGVGLLLGNDQTGGALEVNGGTLTLQGGAHHVEQPDPAGAPTAYSSYAVGAIVTDQSGITVNGGTLDLTGYTAATNLPAEQITLGPNAAVADGAFDGTACRVESRAPEYALHLPDGVTAWTDREGSDVTVTAASSGERIHLTYDAEQLPEGQYVRSMASDDVDLELWPAGDGSLLNVSFYMPDTEVTVTWELIDQEAYTLDLSDGGADVPFAVAATLLGFARTGNEEWIYLDFEGDGTLDAKMPDAMGTGTAAPETVRIEKEDTCSVTNGAEFRLPGARYSPITVITKHLLYGDINADTAVNAADALLALQHSVKLITLTGDKLTVGNVDGNDAVNAADALLILQYSVKLITRFPVEG